MTNPFAPLLRAWYSLVIRYYLTMLWVLDKRVRLTVWVLNLINPALANEYRRIYNTRPNQRI